MVRVLDGMVVAISGASAGIGRALAVALAGGGARLALCARRLDQLERLDHELGGDHLIMRADLAEAADCQRFVASAHARFGRIDTLVCNAGSGLLRRVADTSVEDWQRLLAVNLLGTTACIHAALPLMRAQAIRDGWRGQVMIVSSCLARRGMPDLGAYSATKAAQLAAAEALRIEERAVRIAVTSVHPVGTATEFTAAAERASGRALGARAKGEIVQSAEHVAAAMVAGIIRPRPEVWPHRPSRWLFGLATLMPGLVDHAILRFGRRRDGR